MLFSEVSCNSRESILDSDIFSSSEKSDSKRARVRGGGTCSESRPPQTEGTKWGKNQVSRVIKAKQRLVEMSSTYIHEPHPLPAVDVAASQPLALPDAQYCHDPWHMTWKCKMQQAAPHCKNCCMYCVKIRDGVGQDVFKDESGAIIKNYQSPEN